MKDKMIKSKIGVLALSLMMILCMMLSPISAFADTSTIPMYLTVKEEPLVFDVTERISMEAMQGSTDLSVTPVTVTNNGKKIKVSSIVINPASGWTVESASTDFDAAGKKSLGFTCNSHDFSTGAYAPGDQIETGSNLMYTLSGKVSASADVMASTQVASMVVTVEKASPAYPAYLTFTGNEEFSIRFHDDIATWDGMLEYSTDTTTWATWDGEVIDSAENTIYLRGTGNTQMTSDTGFLFEGTDSLKVACEGNIENLLDWETVQAGGHPMMLAEYCYDWMFAGCTNIKLSETQTGEYQTEYRIPASGEIDVTALSDTLNEVYSMFSDTGGTFTGTPDINTTYYTSNKVK